MNTKRLIKVGDEYRVVRHTQQEAAESSLTHDEILINQLATQLQALTQIPNNPISICSAHQKRDPNCPRCNVSMTQPPASVEEIAEKCSHRICYGKATPYAGNIKIVESIIKSAIIEATALLQVKLQEAERERDEASQC